MNKTLYIFAKIILLSFLFMTDADAQTLGMDSDMFASMKAGDKAAVIAVHFGTTNEVARVNNIERFNAKLQQAFPKYDFREAWTSRIVIKKMQANGIVKQTPSEVIENLRLEGFTHILIQPSNIIEGIEMDYLRHEVERFRKSFKDIRVSDPLLADTEDYYKAIDATLSITKDKKTATVLVCHGSAKEKNTQYTMLDYVLHDKGFTNWTVATIEGFPSKDNMIKFLKEHNIKKVTLIPFMFVAGEHAHNDIEIEWKKALEAEKIKVKTILKGLGENDAILNIFVDHAKKTSKFRRYTNIERKLQSSMKE